MKNSHQIRSRTFCARHSSARAELRAGGNEVSKATFVLSAAVGNKTPSAQYTFNYIPAHRREQRESLHDQLSNPPGCRIDFQL
jgi:hypothetical protein